MIRLSILASIAIAGATACTSARDRAPAGDSAAPDAAAPPAARATYSVQLAALSDSGRAAAMRDSLEREGWTSGIARIESGGAALWRVHVLPTTDEALATMVAAALRDEGREALPSHEPPPTLRDATGARLVVVNHGTHGMAARTRWALSPDRRAMLAVEDPAAVEADPVPNGFVYASEATRTAWQHDGVWDVAPSPDWSRLAYSQAHLVRGERETRIPRAEWVRMAREIPPPVRRQLVPADTSAVRFADSLSSHSFPTSGMTLMAGVAITHVLPTATLTERAGRAAGDLAVRFGGWRLGWTRAGDTLAIGASPRGSQDHAPSPYYVLALPRPTADSLGVRDSSALAAVVWQEGPTLDISQGVDMRAAHAIGAGGRRIESAGGWIRVRDRRGGRAAIVGPGLPLAATANGRFVAALAPRPDAERHEAPTILVVYEIP